MALMSQRKPKDDPRQIDSDLVYESAIAFLSQPEGLQNLMKTISGAKDIGTAVGKVAALVISRITEELEKAGMPIDEDSLFGPEGGLTKVLTAIYVIANKNGAGLAMEDSLLAAYEVAEADIEKLLATKASGGQGQTSTQWPPGAPPGGLMAQGGATPQGPPQMAPGGPPEGAM